MLWYFSLTLKLNVDSHTAWKYHPMAQCYQLSSLRYCCAYSLMCSFVILFLWFSFCICHPTVYNHSRLVFFFLDFGYFSTSCTMGFLILVYPIITMAFFMCPPLSEDCCALMFSYTGFHIHVHQLCKNIAFVCQTGLGLQNLSMCRSAPSFMSTALKLFKKVDVCDIFHIIRHYLHS